MTVNASLTRPRPMTLIAALACLVVWILFTFVFPLGPAGTPLHLLLGASGVLLVRWWALRVNGQRGAGGREGKTDAAAGG